MRLEIELIPESSWYDNARSQLPRAEWDRLRKMCYRRADYRCEICGERGVDQGFGHALECHEVWEFDEQDCVQRLIRLIALCPMCHKCKHPGKAHIDGFYEKVLKHLQKVNKIRENEALGMIEEAFTVWRNRSRKKWRVDVSALTPKSIQLPEPGVG